MACTRCGGEAGEADVCPRCKETVGYKKDAGKSRPGLVASLAMLVLSRVLAKGAAKYSDDNWRHGMSWRRVADALLRHMFLWLGGEDVDPESGEPHLGHVMCNAMFLLEYQLTGSGIDDRWKYKPEVLKKLGGAVDLKKSWSAETD